MSLVSLLEFLGLRTGASAIWRKDIGGGLPNPLKERCPESRLFSCVRATASARQADITPGHQRLSLQLDPGGYLKLLHLRG